MDEDDVPATSGSKKTGAKKEKKAEAKKRPAPEKKAKEATEPKAKKAKPTVNPLNRYFDDMAAEDEDEDEDVDEATNEKTRKLKEKQAEEDKEFEEELRRQDKRREREALFEGDGADVAGVAKALEDRYQRSRMPAGLRREFGGGGDEESLLGDRGSLVFDAARQANAPALSDPRLWAVPCKIGKEKEAALSLMNKAIAKERAGAPLGISAVLCTGLKGFIYMESRTEPAARAAVQGLRLIRRWSMKMVPVCDMVSVVTTQAKKKKTAGRGDGILRVGDWARVSRDKYRGDLCRVVAVGDGGSSAVIQLVPRVDPGAAPGSKVRPPQRLFSAAEVSAAGDGHEVSQRRFKGTAVQKADGGAGAARSWPLAEAHFDFYENNFYRRGFLYREVTVATMLKREQVVPTLDELQRFVTSAAAGDPSGSGGWGEDDVDEDEDVDEETARRRKEASRREMDSLAEQIEELAKGSGEAAAPSALYQRGDRVACVEGELKNLSFIVKFVEEKEGAASAVVHCEPHGESAKLFPGGAAVQIEASRLVKSIAVGSRVSVSDGRYAGQTGIVLEQGVLKGELVAVVLTDHSGREISVRLAHVHETSAVARGLDSLEGYELHDIVQLPLGAVGVVSNVGADDLEVITNRGATRRARPAEISRKLNQESRRTISLDAREEHVREGDHVIIEAGDRRGTEATVVKAYRAILWLQQTNTAGGFGTASGGLFFAKARQVRVAGNRAAAGGLADSYMGLGRQRNVDEDQFNQTKAGGGGALRRPTKDPYLGRTVRICKGNHKGLVGIVTTATASHVTVELHTRKTKTTLPRERVKLIEGEAGGEALKVTLRDAAAERGYEADLATPLLQNQTPLPNAGQTPQYGGQTPLVGARTPQHGAFTPAHGGGYTPMHGGQYTPAHQSSYGAGTPSHTPAHRGSMTPVADRNGASDVWAPSLRQEPTPSHPADANEDETYLGVNRRPEPAAAATLKAPPPPAAAAPAADEPALASAGAWCVAGACALLHGAGDAECRVDRVDAAADAAEVTVRETKQRRTVPCAHLRRLHPVPKDTVRVVDNDATYDAELLSIEDNDGIIKLDNGEYKIIDFSAIARLAKARDYA